MRDCQKKESLTESSITINTNELSRRRTKQLRTLSQKKFRDEYEQFIVEGRRAVDAAVAAQAPLVEGIIAESALRDARIQALVERMSVPVYACPDHVFDDISQVHTAQGVLAVVNTQYRSPEELTRGQSIVALDGIQDPGNVGTLMRTAAWFGIDGLMAGTGTVDLVNPKVVRAAMGAHWELELVRVSRLDEVITEFAKRGFTPYAADLEGMPVQEWKPEPPSLLVLGSEAHGVSAAVMQAVHGRVRVGRPPGLVHDGSLESLNVAVAGGIILSHWMT